MSNASLKHGGARPKHATDSKLPDQLPSSRTLPDAYQLTEGERRVLYMLSRGLSDREIAQALGVTVHTVNKQVGAVLQKMNARSRTAAAVRALRENLLPALVACAVLLESLSPGLHAALRLA